jgi:Heterokaryon incompatibility protein (HET)
MGLTYMVPLFSGLTLNVLSSSSFTQAFDRARTWLEYCERNDHNCRPSSTDTNLMPRRLLDVQSRASSDFALLFEPKQTARYACLSYCWGTNLDGVLRTTNSNVQKHRSQGIACESLPKAIQDAVAVCRGLGIPYLWVDSLCIIQDDPEDWASEAPRMLEIYGRSHLTVFANETDSCKNGFLGLQRYGNSAWQQSLQTPLPPEFLFPADAVSLYHGEALRSRIAPGTATDGAGSPISSHRMAKSKLDSRGWCLQEELLPNRRLYFNGNEMTWECCTRSFCECGHMNEDKRPNWSSASETSLTELKMFLGFATARRIYYSPEKMLKA